MAYFQPKIILSFTPLSRGNPIEKTMNETSSTTRASRFGGEAKAIKYDEIDSAPEERERGITVNVAHVDSSDTSSAEVCDDEKGEDDDR